MKKLVPAAHDILVPYDKTYLNVPPQLDALHKEAAMLNINIIEVPVETPEELQTKLDALFKEGQKIDAIVNIAETVSGDPSYVEVLGKFAEEHEIPWGGALTLKKDGYTRESLFGISVDPVAVGQQAAQLAEKILVGGIPAGTIPVSSAESYFVINYGAMTKMGITPDKSILAGAQEVIR
jgi:ABC-type uncharacterized transport system substrate-binding protein